MYYRPNVLVADLRDDDALRVDLEATILTRLHVCRRPPVLDLHVARSLLICNV